MGYAAFMTGVYGSALTRLAAVGACVGVLAVAGCSAPGGKPMVVGAATGYEAPSTGSLIGGGEASDRINKNGDPSFYMPQNGPGAAGSAQSYFGH